MCARTVGPLTWVLVVLAGACSGRGDGAGPKAEAPLWTVEEEGRIGSQDDPEQSLVRVGDVRIAGDGRLYVTQPTDRQVRVYAPDGTLERTIGQNGEGPGEFRTISGLGFRGDTLYASDAALNRVTFFGRDGEVIRSEQWPASMIAATNGGFMAGAPQVLRADGSGLVRPGAFVRAMSGQASGPQTATTSRALFRAERDPAALDTVVWIEVSYTSNSAPIAGGGVARFGCPFATSPLLDLRVDGSGVVVVDRTPAPSLDVATFAVVGLDPAGDTAFVTEVPYQPVTVEAERVAREVEGIRAPYLNRDRPAPSAPDVEAALRKMDCIPAALPPVRDLVTAQDGTIWLGREEEGDRPVEWDVLGADGAWIGRLVLPAGETVAAASGETLVTTWTDELDVPYLTRYRLTR